MTVQAVTREEALSLIRRSGSSVEHKEDLFQAAALLTNPEKKPMAVSAGTQSGSDGRSKATLTSSNVKHLLPAIVYGGCHKALWAFWVAKNLISWYAAIQPLTKHTSTTAVTNHFACYCQTTWLKTPCVCNHTMLATDTDPAVFLPNWYRSSLLCLRCMQACSTSAVLSPS